MLKRRFVGRGLHLLFRHPEYPYAPVPWQCIVSEAEVACIWPRI